MSNDIVELANQIQDSLRLIHARESSNQSRADAQKALEDALASRDHLVIPSCLYLLTGNGDSLGCHFALSTISKFITQKGSGMREDEWQGLKSGLLQLFQGAGDLPFFVMSKLIDVIGDVAIRTWPSDWPELLHATLGASNGWGICLFGRICDALSEESLSTRCIVPERQLSLRIGIASVAEDLANACTAAARNLNNSNSPVFQWILELIRGMVIATKQSSFLIKHGLHEIVLRGFVSATDPNIKMTCVETLGYFIYFLGGQSGRSYMVPRGSREQDFTLLEGILKTCHGLLEPSSVRSYFEDEELRDCVKSFFDLLTDIRKTPNIFSYFPDLQVFRDVLVRTASIHPSLHVQVAALGNVDALLRGKHTAVTRDIMLLCLLACNDFYTTPSLDQSSLPSESFFPHLSNRKEVTLRRELCENECDEDGIKPTELVGKLKNAALLCVRHIATMNTDTAVLDFLREILTDAIRPGIGVSGGYYAALLFTEAVATAVASDDPRQADLSQIVDIVSGQCFPGKEQDYLWFIGKAGALISANCLQSVFEIVLKMDIATQFPAQVAFISLCRNNRHAALYVSGLHQALQTALGGESRSWAIGAILSASAHGGLGAADGFAVNVYQDVFGKLEELSSSIQLEDFAKRASPIFATLKAVLEVPLSPDVADQLARGTATVILPKCWTRLFAGPSAFEVGPNEYLSVLGSQFLESAGSTSANANAAFQLYLSVTQVAGLCLGICPDNQETALQALVTLFDPSWKLRPSLINILVTSAGASRAASRPLLVCKSVLPAAIRGLHSTVNASPTDEFTLASLGKAASSIVNCLLSALQITTDDEFILSEFSGAPKPTLSNRQVKAQQRVKNRFSAISEDSVPAASPQPMGHRIPRELWNEPEIALSLVAKCLSFRSDKALRRIAQSVPTILTRWWNSVSHDPRMSASFVATLPELILKPILEILEMVRRRDPVVLTGGQLHSYATERAVSGRRLASELVDHATISIHGVLSVLWRFGSSQMGGSSADPYLVVSSFPPLGCAVRMILDATCSAPSNESIDRIISCAKEQSLESRAALKFLVEGATRDQTSLVESPGLIGATSRDLSTAKLASAGSQQEETVPPGNLFDH